MKKTFSAANSRELTLLGAASRTIKQFVRHRPGGSVPGIREIRG